MSGAGAEAEVMDGSGRLAENVVHFARVLRRAGLAVGPAHALDAVAAIEVGGIESRTDFYWTLHAVFVSKRDQHLIFDQAFEVFWRSRDLVEKMLALLSPVSRPGREPEKPKAGAQRLAAALSEARPNQRPIERPEVEVDARFTVSDAEILQTKDFAQMSAAEIATARAALQRLVLPLDAVRSRRMVPSPRGRLVDPRRTLRGIIRAGGELGRLEFRDHGVTQPPIVALLDISGSMSQYSRVFLHFLHALMERRRHVSTFLFGTRLTNVTRALALKDPDEALEACSVQVADWSGGTRIGTALADFNRHWSRRVLSGGPIVLLITDGLERDSADDLGRETERLAKSCRRLIWLNPLLRFDGFEARAGGIRQMLPHVHEFRPIHNLDAIADLVRELSGGAGLRAEHDPRRWRVAG